MVSGAFQQLTGGDNVRSALENRLSTSLRSIPFRPEYGANLKEFMNLPMTADNISRIEQEVQTQVLRDPRVKEVRKIEVTTQTNGLVLIRLNLVLVGTNENLNVEVVT